MRTPMSDEGWSIEQARARLERRRQELQQLLDWLDTDPSSAQPVAFIPVDPFECDGGVEELELRAVERALERMDKRSYGECDHCHGPIEPERLAAVPWSRCCAECIAFWEGELRTNEVESSTCASCRDRLAGDRRVVEDRLRAALQPLAGEAGAEGDAGADDQRLELGVHVRVAGPQAAAGVADGDQAALHRDRRPVAVVRRALVLEVGVGQRDAEQRAVEAVGRDAGAEVEAEAVAAPRR